MTNRKPFAALAAALSATVLSGCAGMPLSGWDPFEPEVADVRPRLKQRSDEAVARFDRERNEAQYAAAETSWRQGDYERCREALEKVLLRDPNHRNSLLLSADVALETDRPEEAVETLRRLAALDPQDAEAAYRLGVALEAVGDVAAALPYLRQAVEFDPTNPKYADAVPEAERQLTELKEQAGDTTDADFAAALAEWEAGRDEAANRLVTGFLTKHPDHVEANILKAEIDLAAGLGDDALQRMDRLAVRYPHDPQICRATGLMFETLGNARAAEHCFAEARRLTKQDQVEPATYEGAIASDETTPPEPPSAAVLAQAETVAARERLRAAVERGTDDPQAALAASIEALKLEQPELALELATAGAKRFPRSAGLQRACGMAAYRLGRYAEAETALRQSLSLDNSQALSYFLLGSALDRLGKTDEAERYRNEAARLDVRYASRK